MKDIPLFEAEGGLASLVLSQIPLTQTAWVVVHTAPPGHLRGLVKQCGFACRLCGAKRVFVCFDQAEDRREAALVPAYEVVRLEAEHSALGKPGGTLELAAVGSEEGAAFVRAYHTIFQSAVHAKLYRQAEAPMLLGQGDAFWVLPSGGGGAVPVGLGITAGQELLALGLLPKYRGQGLGRELVRLLAGQIHGDRVLVHTTSENTAALNLYQGLGFSITAVVETWDQLPNRNANS